jgi:pantothenate kinase
MQSPHTHAHSVASLVDVVECVLAERRRREGASTRVLVAIGGICGSGKTTLAGLLCAALNGSESEPDRAVGVVSSVGGAEEKTANVAAHACEALHGNDSDSVASGGLEEKMCAAVGGISGCGEKKEDRCVVVPLDGFHFSLAQLHHLPSLTYTQALARRGAHWTFDCGAFLETLQALRNPSGGQQGEVYVPSFDHALGGTRLCVCVVCVCCVCVCVCVTVRVSESQSE